MVPGKFHQKFISQKRIVNNTFVHNPLLPLQSSRIASPEHLLKSTLTAQKIGVLVINHLYLTFSIMKVSKFERIWSPFLSSLMWST